MRVLVFFDLPRNTSLEIKAANSFRKKLLKEGFLMLQESVYCKLVLNQTALEYVKQRVKKDMPKNGSIMILIVTEKQFSAMEICCDSFASATVATDKRLIIV